jgi:hypothetical protein
MDNWGLGAKPRAPGAQPSSNPLPWTTGVLGPSPERPARSPSSNPLPWTTGVLGPSPERPARSIWYNEPSETLYPEHKL